jgi:glycerophosphoryl diester phosphodiesterase
VDWLTAVPYAHRGWHDLARGVPENSLPAFQAAADAGYAIELDVQLTSDGEVVVVHDLDLRRVAGSDDLVRATTWSRLRSLRLEGTRERLPLLGEVLEVVAGRVPLMVEVKNVSRAVGRLEEAVLRHVEGYDGPVSVASFNPGTVRWFGLRAPHVVRGQTAGPLRDVEMPRVVRLAMSSMLGNTRARPHYLSYDLAGLPNRAVDFWRRGGRPLITWTVQTAADLEKARRVADQFIFEHVSVPAPGDATA